MTLLIQWIIFCPRTLWSTRTSETRIHGVYHELSISTKKVATGSNITPEVTGQSVRQKILRGICLFQAFILPGALTINENARSDVERDFFWKLGQLVPLEKRLPSFRRKFRQSYKILARGFQRAGARPKRACCARDLAVDLFLRIRRTAQSKSLVDCCWRIKNFSTFNTPVLNSIILIRMSRINRMIHR